MKNFKYIGLCLSSWEGLEDVEDCVKVTCSSQTRTYQIYFADMASIEFFRFLCRLISHYNPQPFEIKTLRLTIGRIMSFQAKYNDGVLSDFVNIKTLSVESDLETWLLSLCPHRLFEQLKPKLI